MEWILLAVFAGVSNGAFALPMKFTKKWNWEHTWSAFILWGFVVFPVLLGVATVPGLWDIFREVGARKLGFIVLFGFLWGIGSICFGLGIRYLGIGLAFSLNIGITIAIGSLLPLFLAETSSEKRDVVVFAGVLTIIIGVVINGYAAFLREKNLSIRGNLDSSDSKPAVKNTFMAGTILCVIAGIMSPMLQFAFIHGGSIVKSAVSREINETMASNAVWTVALFGGFLANICYVTVLLSQNNSWALYKIRESRQYHLLALLMGFLWVVTIACYGMAVSNLGVLGLSVGWAIFNAVGIITANLLGLLTGEWQGVKRKTRLAMAGGLVVLVAGTCLVAMA